VDNELGSWIT